MPHDVITREIALLRYRSRCMIFREDDLLFNRKRRRAASFCDEEKLRRSCGKKVSLVRFGKIHVWKTKQDDEEKSRNNLRRPPPRRSRCVLIEAWRRFSRSRVCLHDFCFDCNRLALGWKMESLLVYFGSMFTKRLAPRVFGRSNEKPNTCELLLSAQS